jgi:heme A synthase
MSERRVASSMVAPHRRNAGAFVVLYLGLLALLLVEQFVVHVPPIGYIDVALLFVVVNVLLGLERARSALRLHGTLRSAVLGVLPVAGLSTAVGALIVVASGSEPTVLATVIGGLVFLALFLGATAGIQYASQRRRNRSGKS